MPKHGKKYRKAVELVNKDMFYKAEEAIILIEKTNTVKFDPTVEIHFNLNLDPKHVDQMIRTTCSLPNGSGKTSKICAITDWDTKALLAAGATVAWGEELIDDIAQGNVALDFDTVVATPSMMRHLGKIARVLGPKGLMPNPKAGTVTPDLETAIKEIAAGKFEFRTDKHGNIHSIFGKLSFGKDKLVENLNFFLNLINDIKPSGAKAKYINTVFICNAMWPSIALDLSSDEK
jgi:large subunit ribosomal protein L1